MHIKVERFLTLTAMLASTQVGLVGCGDDGSGDEPSANDAGNTNGTSGPSSTSQGDSVSADSGAANDTGELNATLDTSDLDTPDLDTPDSGAGSDAVVADAGDVAPTGDADVVMTDAGDAVTEQWTDAGSETPWLDAGGETWTDAGGEMWTDAGSEGCLAGDFADEVDTAACYGTFGACGTSYAADTCGILVSEYRAGIVETFWDCYNDSNIEDPCSESAEYAVNGCYSFAMENAPLCAIASEECEAVVASCSEVTLESCEAIFMPYNSGRRSSSVYCYETLAANQAGPDYEGCGYDFTGCVYSPAIE
jgi:hypothetical protein